MNVATRIAWRELRGGLAGFRIFLLCLTLGVAGIATIGSVRTAIERGLSAESSALLGGDADIALTYRLAATDELQWMQDNADAVSRIVDFRSMVTMKNSDGAMRRGLVQVKGVDTIYPLYGAVGMTPDQPLDAALADKDGLPGMIAAPALLTRLGANIGDVVTLGGSDFRLVATLQKEPDSAAAGFSFGPRVIVSSNALEAAGLLSTGTLFTSHYRLKLPAASDLAALQAKQETDLPDRGIRWSDTRDATPGLNKFVERMGSFLVIVGLAGLAVGGIGVSAAVRAYLDRKKPVIATLKTLGAGSGTVFTIYLLQIGALALIGIMLGIVLGVGLPILFGPLLGDSLPVPARFAIYGEPMLEAGLYGLLTALMFTIWPLARAINIRAAALFRDETSTTQRWPKWYFILLVAALAGGLVALAAWFSGVAMLAVWAAVGVIVALAALLLAAFMTRKLAARLARSKLTHGWPILRLALSAIGGPGGEAGVVILSLGLGLAVLATIGQIDTNMRRNIAEELPSGAPSYFFVDIQKDQFQGFVDIANGTDGITKTRTAPTLRGVLSKVNGEDARKVLGDSWILSGDRGVTYATTPPEGNEVTAGTWWEADYNGPPLMSFSAHDAAELGLKLGDTITVNILGRDLTATITAFHNVAFSNMGINFVMIVNPAALATAPHTYLATAYGTPTDNTAFLSELGKAYPNITAIRVSDAIDRVTEILVGISAAIRWGAAVTLLTGFVVLIGAAAAAERQRVYEAALLKTLGATRARILTGFALRSAILGAAAGAVAIAAGGLAGWAVLGQVMAVTFVFDLPSALWVVGGGAIASLLAGLAFVWRPLMVRPAQILRSRE